MTIKIEAWQAHGEKVDRCVEKFEFCCWLELQRWLNGFGSGNLNKCPECRQSYNPVAPRAEVFHG